MKKEAKAEIHKPEVRGLPAIEKRKQPEVLPKSGPGSSSKSGTSKTTDRKRPKQVLDVRHSLDTTSQPPTSTYCSPFSEAFSISSEASDNSSETSEKSNEISKKSNESSKKPKNSSKKPAETPKKLDETSKKPTESNESTSEVSKKERQTPKKPRKPSKCPYCPVIMTRTNDLRKHVEIFHQGPQEMLCHMCDFRCNDIVTYLAHENDHLCKCPYCGYTAKNYRGLPRHKTFCRLNPNYEESTLSMGGFRHEGKETKRKE